MSYLDNFPLRLGNGLDNEALALGIWPLGLRGGFFRGVTRTMASFAAE